MKIKIIDNTRIKKKDLVSLVEKAPSSWGFEVGSLVIYPAISSGVVTSFHRSRKELGIRISTDYAGSIDDILCEVAITLQVIQDYGHIPKSVPKERIAHYISAWHLLDDHF